MHLLFFLFLSLVYCSGFAQKTSNNATICNGILLSYTYTGGAEITPTDPSNQPYRFTSTLRVQNQGRSVLKSWQVFVGFNHDEYLVSATNAVLADGTSLPAAVGNGTVFAGYPVTDLKTAIETAGDSSLTSVVVNLIGTQFGVPLSSVPLPNNISLINEGFHCPSPSNTNTSMAVCCIEDPNKISNPVAAEPFLHRQNGDLTMTYDVVSTYESNYWAKVTIENHNPLGRLDSWQLSWDWMRGEFIYTMKGAYPSIVDSSDCIFGQQGTYYQGMDFSNVLNCQRRPTIVDLPATLYNNTDLGYKPYCCRNGTLLPPSMDPSKSISSFLLQVYKLPPDLNRSVLTPPQNWKIKGTLNPVYKCSPPIRVSPSQSLDSSGVPVNESAVASWQVVCNITRSSGIKPKCCVSFSAFYNDSVIPCGTCACGCGTSGGACSASEAAILLPPQALLVPFENRTAMTLSWAKMKRLRVPEPLPCGDNCGVSINWHVYTDFAKGWSASVTLFNWGEVAYADWFAAVELGKAARGFEAMYSFNGSVLSGVNDTLIMQGMPGLNHLIGESNGSNPVRDPRVPGKQHSVISFTKKLTPDIKVAAGDGFPSKVYFNGEECAIPSTFPRSRGFRDTPAMAALLLVWVTVLFDRISHCS